MKQLTSILAAASLLLSATAASAQKKAEDKSQRPSPPAVVTQKIASGATITIDYSRPSVKGRTIGKDLEPMDGEVWRAGANEATVFETDKAVKIEGKSLAAGKYAFFTKKDGTTWTLIFNKTWKTWGAYDYDKNKAADALQVKVKEMKAGEFTEKLTYNISPEGKVVLAWGDKNVSFKVGK